MHKGRPRGHREHSWLHGNTGHAHTWVSDVQRPGLEEDKPPTQTQHMLLVKHCQVSWA